MNDYLITGIIVLAWCILFPIAIAIAFRIMKKIDDD